MSEEDKRRAMEHTAGATVRHAAPFAHLEVEGRRESPEPEFVKDWILPYYQLDPSEMRFHEAFMARADRVDDALVKELLSFFNWRPRIVGAYFAAILRSELLVDVIEPLLLRSDLCYAGRGYCLALASIDTPRVAEILERYLDHYLTTVDLWFDQADALAALRHLDAVLGTDRATQYVERWAAFVVNKPTWDLRKTEERFSDTLSGLARCRAALRLDHQGD